MNKQLIASILSLSMLTSSASAMSATSASPGSYREISGVQSGNSEIIRDELKSFRVLVDSGTLSQKDALIVFSKNLTERGARLADIDAYVKEHTTRTEYRSFKADLEEALSGINVRSMTSQEVTQVMSRSLASLNVDGLSWAGCASQGIGVVLLVVAAVAGLIELNDTNVTACHGLGCDGQTAQEFAQWLKDVEAERKGAATLFEILAPTGLILEIPAFMGNGC